MKIALRGGISYKYHVYLFAPKVEFTTGLKKYRVQIYHAIDAEQLQDSFGDLEPSFGPEGTEGEEELSAPISALRSLMLCSSSSILLPISSSEFTSRKLRNCLKMDAVFYFLRNMNIIYTPIEMKLLHFGFLSS